MAENRFKLTGGQILLEEHQWAELRAEVERLTQADRQWADHVKRLADERDRMETWARAEQSERFKAEEQRTDERSNVERLRAALEDILGCTNEYSEDIAKIASEALARPKVP